MRMRMSMERATSISIISKSALADRGLTIRHARTAAGRRPGRGSSCLHGGGYHVHFQKSNQSPLSQFLYILRLSLSVR